MQVLYGATLIQINDLRINRIAHLASNIAPRCFKARLLYLTICSSHDHEIVLPPWIGELLGIFTRKDLHRIHAPQFPNIQRLASDALGSNRYPDWHANWIQHLSATSVPPHTCHVGTSARFGLLVRPNVAKLRLCIRRFVSIRCAEKEVANLRKQWAH